MASLNWHADFWQSLVKGRFAQSLIRRINSLSEYTFSKYLVPSFAIVWYPIYFKRSSINDNAHFYHQVILTNKFLSTKESDTDTQFLNLILKYPIDLFDLLYDLLRVAIQKWHYSYLIIMSIKMKINTPLWYDKITFSYST